MAKAKSSSSSTPNVLPEEDRNAGRVEGAADGGVSNRTAGYSDNPDAPDPSSVAQVEELKDVGE